MNAFIKNALLAFAALLLTTVATTVHAQQSQPAITVVVTYPGLSLPEVTLEYPQPIRLNVLLQDATTNLTTEQLGSINWSKARLGSDKLNEQFKKKQNDLDAKLANLARFWRDRGEHNYRSGINFIRRQLNDQTYFPSYYMGLEPDRTRLVLQENPFITQVDGSTFYLRLSTGRAQSIELGLDKASDAASSTHTFAIAVNGNIAKKPTGLYNTGEPGECFRHDHTNPLANKSTGLCDIHITVPGITLLSDHVLQSNKNLNQEIAELAKFAVGASQ